jgi:soluble lytic murein transglycosylase-like protein
MAVKLWGPMLTGIAQGFGDYQKGQEDLAYTRQVRAQDLQKGQLANQAQEMQNTAAQQALQNADLTHKYWVNALQDDSAPPAQQGQQAAQQAGPANAAGAPQAAGVPQQGQQPASDFKPVGPMSMDQLAALDKKNNLPIGTSYGVMAAESAGKPDAVSRTGAEGLFQVQPTTAAQPGYGLKPFNPKDPDGAVGYLGKMFQKAGGDPAKALAYYNAGPGGNPDNPETKAYIPKVQSAAKQFAAAYQLNQAKQQPTPAQQVQARDDAGAPTPPPVYQQAVQAQSRQIQTMLSAAQSAEKDGHPELAQQFYKQAQELQTQQQTLQEKSFKVQKDANEETAKLAVGVNDQSSYNNWRSQVAQNPAMQSAVAGLGLTGDYNQDRNKMATLASRTETLAQQHGDAIKQQEFQLKQQVEQRKQAQEDAANVRASTAQVADQNRQTELSQKGIPFAPSLAATLPKGTTPAVAQKAQQAVQKVRADYLTKDVQGSQAARQVQDFSKQLLGLLDGPDPVTTGGMTRVPGIGMAFTAFEDKRQLFDKVGNQLVSAAAAANGAAGGGRSAFTAAMYDRLKTQKPNLDLNHDVNKAIALEYYNAQSIESNMRNFTHEFLQANPDATPQAAQLQWASYEQSLGPIGYVDPDAPNGYRPNTAGVPKLPDGRPNPNYKDYHDFFKGQQ